MKAFFTRYCFHKGFRYLSTHTPVKPYVFSGIQPTGTLHIGNYLGAIRNWIQLQNDSNYEKSFFCIVDLHATTVFQEPKQFSQSTFKLACTLLACGLDPKKCALYVQSHLPAHVELCWILGCITPVGWLNRMIQYKQKRETSGANLGLLSYPVLQAADVLLYSHETKLVVPIGEDQKQHLELARNVAMAFNSLYKVEFFKLPTPLYTKEATRVMSLADGTKKMSKSDILDRSRINITDDEETIRAKIKRAKSDCITGIYYDREKRPEISNLVDIYAALEGMKVEEVVNKYETSNTLQFKEALAEVIIKHMGHIAPEIQRLEKDPQYIADVLKQGRDQAAEVAEKTLEKVKKTVGYSH